MILAPCVDFRPAPGCRPPGPRRDTASVGAGVAGFSAPSALTIHTSTPRRRCPKGVLSGIRAYKCANLRAEGGRFENTKRANLADHHLVGATSWDSAEIQHGR